MLILPQKGYYECKTNVKKIIKMKRPGILLLFIIISLSGQAQKYETGIGVRGSRYDFGITGKHFFKESTAIEGILDFGYGSFIITGLYEIHAPAFDVDRLYWYYGGGAHIGQVGDAHHYLDSDKGVLLLGIDGIIGLEYDIEEIPITISADWKPTINFNYRPALWGGLSFRYTF